MNRAELVEALMDRTEMTRRNAGDVVTAMFNPNDGIIARALKKGDRIAITGFGVFGVRRRAARPGRNPATGEALRIAASKVPKFTPGASLKAVVNGKAPAARGGNGRSGGSRARSAAGRRR